jgi:hypothetical protein
MRLLRVFIATNLQSEFHLQQVVKETHFFIMIKVGMEVAHETLFVDFSFSWMIVPNVVRMDPSSHVMVLLMSHKGCPHFYFG